MQFPHSTKVMGSLLLLLLCAFVGGSWAAPQPPSIIDSLQDGAVCHGDAEERTEILPEIWELMHPPYILRLVSNIHLLDPSHFLNQTIDRCYDKCRVYVCAAVRFIPKKKYCEISKKFELTRGNRVLFKLRTISQEELVIIKTDTAGQRCLNEETWNSWKLTGELDEQGDQFKAMQEAFSAMNQKKLEGSDKQNENSTISEAYGGATIWISPTLVPQLLSNRGRPSYTPSSSYESAIIITPSVSKASRSSSTTATSPVPTTTTSLP